MLAPSLTILLSSFLLFLVQPILAKEILPWFGGSAGVWTICLVFFQMVLLLGYAYSHWLTKRAPESRQYVLHVVLLLVSCAMLPIIPASFWKPGHETAPALHILGLLAATIGLPYFLLSSTAPLLQRWLSGASENPSQERSIYRLFALSNFGSLVGLISYPFAIEPFSTVHVQAWVWSFAYLLFVVCFASYAWKRRLLPSVRRAPAVGAIVSEAPPSPRIYVYWIACAALGSALLLSVSNQITQNVASIPFLWIVPLSVYILSFVICFEGRAGRGWYERRYWVVPAMLATGVMAWTLFAQASVPSIFLALPLFTMGLFLGCVVCHGELARSKPNPDYLTHFYLSLATGGALGGLLVGIVAPLIFKGYWEMPLVLVGLAALGIYGCSEDIRVRPKTSWTANFTVALLATALILLLLGALPSAADHYTLGLARIAEGDARWGCAVVLVLLALTLEKAGLSRSVAVTALLCTMVLGWSYYHSLTKGTELAVRNFYGTLRVIDLPYEGGHIRWLKHGVIFHGSQIMEPPRRKMPTTYYAETSGIGRTILSKQRTGPLRIGSVGLGAGTLAVYGRTGDLFRVYELNPAVLDVAQNEFTYLKESKSRVEPVLGDGRLSLEFEIAHGAFNDPEQRFDVLSLDAFSGDAIPVHLITREAFATYARVIKSDGVIAFHLTNKYLNLPPVVEQIAHDAGFHAILIADRPGESGLGVPSEWMLVTKSTAFLQQLQLAVRPTPIVSRISQPVWTDQFSNLFEILK